MLSTFSLWSLFVGKAGGVTRSTRLLLPSAAADTTISHSPPPTTPCTSLKESKRGKKKAWKPLKSLSNESTKIAEHTIHKPRWKMTARCSHVALFCSNKARSHHKRWLMGRRVLCVSVGLWSGHYGVKSTSAYLLNKPTPSIQTALITPGSRISPFDIV